jgi:putative transposase
MCRLLADSDQTGELRRERVHPVYTKPELLAVRPSELWSWYITKVQGAVNWETCQLEVIMGILAAMSSTGCLPHENPLSSPSS